MLRVALDKHDNGFDINFNILQISNINKSNANLVYIQSFIVDRKKNYFLLINVVIQI